MLRPETAVEQVLVVANPKASHPDRVERFTGIVQDIIPDAKFLHTQPPDKADNAQLIADNLQDGSLIIVNAGDGTVNDAVNGAKRSGKSDLAFCVIPCGNADDTATGFYGKDHFSIEENIISLLQNGSRVPLPLIRVDQEGEVRYAASYWGMGLTGQAAVEMNRSEYRDLKEARGDGVNRLTDALKVLPLLLPRAKNTYSFGDGVSVRQARELLISSSDHFAREFMVDVDPWEGDVVINEFGPEGFVRGLVERLAKEQYRPTLTKWLAEGSLTPRSLRSALEGRRTSRGIRGIPFEGITLELLQDTPTQFDGEPVRVAGGTVLDISVESDAIHGLRAA